MQFIPEVKVDAGSDGSLCRTLPWKLVSTCRHQPTVREVPTTRLSPISRPALGTNCLSLKSTQKDSLLFFFLKESPISLSV